MTGRVAGLAALVLVAGCAGRLQTYQPRDDRVLEVGRDESVRQLTALLGRCVKPHVEAGSIEVTDRYLYMRAIRDPLPARHHRIEWATLGSVRMTRFEEPPKPPEKWLWEAALLGTAGDELLAVQFFGEADAKAFADLAWSMRAAARPAS